MEDAQLWRKHARTAVELRREADALRMSQVSWNLGGDPG